MAQTAAQLLHYLRRLAGHPGSDPASDAELLDRFARRRDEAAFEALLARHGPLVLRVCRGVLRDLHATEDAFQATFLVLARRATTIRRPGALAAWLHGVAHRVALKARASDYRRQLREAPAAKRTPFDPRPDPLDELSARELLAVVDEELRRLPEVYRLPVILCCLEGRSQEEAARQLGWTPGSVKGRLERGRKRLHARLARRGLTPLAVVAATALSGSAMPAAMPARLAASTTRAALMFAAGKDAAAAGVSGAVAILTKGSLQAMWALKLKLAAVVLAVGVLAGGVGLVGFRVLRADPSKHPTRAEEKPATGSSQAQRARGKERAVYLTKARAEVKDLEQVLHKREQDWTRELIEARKKLVRVEERLRQEQREQANPRGRESNEIKTREQRLARLLREVEQIQRVARVKEPALKRLEDEINQVRRQIKELVARGHRYEELQTSRVIEAREALVEAEEQLRLIERRQETARARGRDRLAAVEDRVRQLEEGAPQGGTAERRLPELERKVDLLLRELKELRRQLRRPSR